MNSKEMKERIAVSNQIMNNYKLDINRTKNALEVRKTISKVVLRIAIMIFFGIVLGITMIIII